MASLSSADLLTSPPLLENISHKCICHKHLSFLFCLSGSTGVVHMLAPYGHFLCMLCGLLCSGVVSLQMCSRLYLSTFPRNNPTPLLPQPSSLLSSTARPIRSTPCLLILLHPQQFCLTVPTCLPESMYSRITDQMCWAYATHLLAN